MLMFVATELGLFEWVMIILVVATLVCIALVIIIAGWAVAEWEWREIFGSGRSKNDGD